MRHWCLVPFFKTFKLLRTFARYMKLSDLVKLLSSPFRRRALTHKPNLTAKMIDLGLEAPVRSSATGP
jgi:anaerobic magnesium-protoporphyrin IX monomethyl ester cyclase